VVVRIRPSTPNATSLPVIAFNCAATASSSRKPTLSVPRISGWVSPIAIGTVTSCSMPLGWGSRLMLSWPASASRIAGCRATRSPACGEAPNTAKTLPDLFVTSSRLELSLRSRWMSSIVRCTVCGSFSKAADLSFGMSPISRASVVNVSVRVVRS
jgi:hypothetical protein